MRPGSRAFRRVSKPVVFLLASAPALWAAAGAFNLAGISLGANPVEALLDLFGLWSLRFLLLTLAVTPLRNWTGQTWLLGYRRMLGLFAFFYVSLHLATYVVLDQGLRLAPLVEDVLKRPFITIGMLAMVLMLPLAITSTRGWMKRLGRGWKRLHRLVYAVAILGVWHYYWQVKLDTLEPLVYAVILLILLAERLRVRQQKLRRQAARAALAARASS